MKLLLDEMWPPHIAIQLRAQGHDVLAVAERPELRGRPDADIFAFAQADGRAILTENVVDYRPLAKDTIERGGSHAGLILTSDHRFPRHDPGTLGRMIVALGTLLRREPDLRNSEYWLR